MHTILGVVLVTTLAFLGTMFDNFFVFTAQLVVTDQARVRRVGIAHATSVAFIIVLASSAGALLTSIPLRWIGLLFVVPLTFAWHSWRRRHLPREQFRRGALTTFAITLSLGGDNLAVWIPLFRAGSTTHALLTVTTFALLEALFLLSARALSAHRRVVAWGNEHVGALLPMIYVLLSLLILIECHTY